MSLFGNYKGCPLFSFIWNANIFHEVMVVGLPKDTVQIILKNVFDFNVMRLFCYTNINRLTGSQPSRILKSPN